MSTVAAAAIQDKEGLGFHAILQSSKFVSDTKAGEIPAMSPLAGDSEIQHPALRSFPGFCLDCGNDEDSTVGGFHTAALV